MQLLKDWRIKQREDEKYYFAPLVFLEFLILLIALYSRPLSLSSLFLDFSLFQLNLLAFSLFFHLSSPFFTSYSFIFIITSLVLFLNPFLFLLWSMRRFRAYFKYRVEKMRAARMCQSQMGPHTRVLHHMGRCHRRACPCLCVRVINTRQYMHAIARRIDGNRKKKKEREIQLSGICTPFYCTLHNIYTMHDIDVYMPSKSKKCICRYVQPLYSCVSQRRVCE